MSLLPDGRQYALRATVDIDLADVSDEVSKNALQLPQNSVVTAIDLIVDTAFDDSTTETLSIGDATSATRYGTTIALGTTGLIAGVAPDGFETTDAEPNITIIYAGGTGDATVGVARLNVEYVVTGRHNENQG
jgi:hypothetical protein